MPVSKVRKATSSHEAEHKESKTNSKVTAKATRPVSSLMSLSEDLNNGNEENLIQDDVSLESDVKSDKKNPSKNVLDFLGEKEKSEVSGNEKEEVSSMGAVDDSNSNEFFTSFNKSADPVDVKSVPLSVPQNTVSDGRQVSGDESVEEPIIVNKDASSADDKNNSFTNMPSFMTVSMNESATSKGNSNRKRSVALIVFLLLALGGIFSYFYWFSAGGSFVNPLNDGSVVDSDGIVDNSGNFESPINGMYFSPADAAKFKDLKPIAVMVNNYEIARPSSGLSKADIIYEAVAEAGITRLMPIFHSRIPESVSSIRSARYYFVELASSYDPHYIHWGAAHMPPCQKAGTCPVGPGEKVETLPETDAYDRIVKLGLPNLDGGNYSCNGDNCPFGRDPLKVGKVPSEHTAFSRLPLIYKLAKDVRPQDTWHQFQPLASWKFKDDAPESERGNIGELSPITYKYWDTQPAFDVKWEYDKSKNEYIRYQGGVKQVDQLDGAELRAKTIIIRYTVQKPANDKKAHLLFDIVGTGKALVFQDGKFIEGTWTRSTHDAMDVYKDLTGEELIFTRGQMWVQLLPPENKVNYSAVTTNSTPTVSPAPVSQ